MDNDNVNNDSKEVKEEHSGRAFLNTLGANLLAAAAKTAFEHFDTHLLDGTPRKE